METRWAVTRSSSSRQSWSALSACTRRRRSCLTTLQDIYREAKGNGLDVKALRTVVRLRAQDAAERREHAAIVETYMRALGMEE